MADGPNNRKLADTLEVSAIEMRVLTTLALTMFDESELPPSSEDGREYREALQWVLLEMKKRSRGWHNLMTDAALRVERQAAH